jgi:hypothetical protein
VAARPGQVSSNAVQTVLITAFSIIVESRSSANRKSA